MLTGLITAVMIQTSIHSTSPPMGWNSYDCYSYAVTEDEVLANAKFMAKNLKRFGWDYVVVDYVWSAPKGEPGFAPEQDADFKPRLNMDTYGRLLPDPGRFPSSNNRVGFKALGDSIHKLGLKFGIHLMRGIPRQATAAKCPIEGSQYDAVQAADEQGVQCKWLNHMWALNMKNGAGQAYLDSIFRLYAAWGVDFVKVDDLSDPYSGAEVEGYQRAIVKSGRPMILSLSPGPTSIDAAPHVSTHANMWRLLWDLWDEWKPLNEAFGKALEWNAYRGPGVWPDLDMLPLGQLRIYGPWTGPRDTPSRFTKDEALTLMNLWIITKSPLMFGGDLTLSDQPTIALLTNAGALEALRNPDFMPRNLQNGLHPVWVSESKNAGHAFLAVFNREETAADISVDLDKLGWPVKKLDDLWDKSTLNPTGATLKLTLAPHASRLFRLE